MFLPEWRNKVSRPSYRSGLASTVQRPRSCTGTRSVCYHAPQPCLIRNRSSNPCAPSVTRRSVAPPRNAPPSAKPSAAGSAPSTAASAALNPSSRARPAATTRAGRSWSGRGPARAWRLPPRLARRSAAASPGTSTAPGTASSPPGCSGRAGTVPEPRPQPAQPIEKRIERFERHAAALETAIFRNGPSRRRPLRDGLRNLRRRLNRLERRVHLLEDEVYASRSRRHRALRDRLCDLRYDLSPPRVSA